LQVRGRLARKNRIVRVLNVAIGAIYFLARRDEGEWSDAVKALTAAAKTKRINAVEGHKIINLARLRREYGKLPAATLLQIQHIEAQP
jgi:hypothetical protein